MTKEEMMANLEDLKYNFSEFASVECVESDVMTIDAVINYIRYGLKVFTTDELIKEIMRRQGVLTLQKVNLDDGAVG